MKKYKTIGVLGGMGAAASADLYRRIVEIVQHEYGAQQDTDFPPMFIYNLPLRGFDETGFVDAEDVKSQLIAGVKKLESMGSDFIVIPCNTVHAFQAEMQSMVSIPICGIIDAVADEVQSCGVGCVGLLTSQSTRQYRLYEQNLEKRGIAFVSATDDEQAQLNSIISHTISGAQGSLDVNQMKIMIDRLASEGARGVILGCTELPLAISQKDTNVPLFSSIDLLARAALKQSITEI